MFLGSTEPELELGFLRSGRSFRLGKRGKIEEVRRDISMFKESEHEIQS